MLMRHFDDYETECGRLLELGLPLPAYDQVLALALLQPARRPRRALGDRARQPTSAACGRSRNVARSYVESLDARAAV